MHKRRLVTGLFVGMVALLVWLSPMSNFGSDNPSSAEKKATPPAEAAAKTNTDANDQITVLKQQMALQQLQIEQMQKSLEEQKRLLQQLTQPAKPAVSAGQAAKPAGGTEQATQPAKPAPGTERAAQPHAASLGEMASTSPMIPQSTTKTENAIAPAAGGSIGIRSAAPAAAGTETSPLQIHIGDATITPVAFMDFTSIYRNHVTNGSIGTNFGNIPFANSSAYAPNLSEFRLSSENSRLGLRVDADVHGAHVLGYMEADFHGYNVTNASIVTNSNTLRERVYWVDLNTGKFEILGGQTWSLITPGRTGISGIPGDVFYSQDIDLNYQLGLVFGRIPELRFVFHPTKQVAFAIALDSPEQYAGGYGGAASIVLPTALNTSSTYLGELDNGSGNTLSTPTVAPDIIAKLAIDPNKHAHFEIGGVERNFKVYDPANTTKYSAEGGGGFVNLNVEVVKGLRLLTNNYWSDGGGRYIYGEAPDLIAHADGSISLVHSGSTVTGFEFAHKTTQIYGYYGGMYVMRNTAVDTNGKLVGWGMGGSSNATSAQNRAIQEATIGFTQTFWKNPKFGALLFMGQYSYLTRSPWYVATGAPPNANVNMVFFNLRYQLPGSAPTMGK